MLPPTLMNKQDQTALCLAGTREWSRHLPMHTVGVTSPLQLGISSRADFLQP